MDSAWKEKKSGKTKEKMAGLDTNFFDNLAIKKHKTFVLGKKLGKAFNQQWIGNI